MPNIKDLAPKDRQRLLGCVANKNSKWRKENKKTDNDKVPQEVNQKHYSECAKDLGLE